MSPATKKIKRIGRPPAGVGGEKVKDYPQVSVRLPAEVRDQLMVLSRMRRQPQWRLIVESVECYLRDLEPEERQKLQRLLREERS